MIEALASPRSLDEVLDELPYDDLEIIEVLRQLLAKGVARRLPQGSLRLQLASPDELNVMQAVLRRVRRPGFVGSPRIVVAAPSSILATVSDRLGRLAESVTGMVRPSALVPYLMVTLHFTENAVLDVVGLPLVERFSPCWSLALPGSSIVVTLGTECPPLLRLAAQSANVRLVEADELVGTVDPTNTAHLAGLLRAVLDALADP